MNNGYCKSVIFLPMELLGVLYNSLKCVHSFKIDWNLEVLVFKERGKPKNPKNTSHSKGENLTQQMQPTLWLQCRKIIEISIGLFIVLYVPIRLSQFSNYFFKSTQGVEQGAFPSSLC